MSSLQLKVQLEDINPVIWRTFQIDQTETFFDLHEILQIVMGWENAHLFEFQIKERKIGLLPDEDEMWDTDASLEDSESILMLDMNLKEGDSFHYIYDFGDNWKHLLTVEKVLADDETNCPICLGGARNCPPEDCGGIWGYADMLETLRYTKNSEADEHTTGLSKDFDPNYFNIDAVNRVLKHLLFDESIAIN